MTAAKDRVVQPFVARVPSPEDYQRLMAEARRLRAETVAGLFRSLWQALSRPADRPAGGRRAHA
ncbi:hypothetical protein SH611_16560 [Geminicoccaceae bacterium 1502E]|nr:hypothetical protein [Geminicoccaceae bacterium 1502E]